MTSNTPNTLSRITQNRTLLVAALLVTAALFGTLTVVELTPSHDLPVGTAVANGDSMNQNGDQFIVYAQIGADVGDVVVFDAGEEHGFVRHRIVESTAQGFVTKGDANQQVDQHTLSPQLDGMPYVTAERIRGVSVFAVPTDLLEQAGAGLVLVVFLTVTYVGRREPRQIGKSFSKRVDTGKGIPAAMALLVVLSLVSGIPFGNSISPVQKAEAATATKTLPVGAGQLADVEVIGGTNEVVALDLDNHLIRYNWETKTEVWNITTAQYSAEIKHHNGAVYVAGGDTQASGNIQKFDASDGSLLWEDLNVGVSDFDTVGISKTNNWVHTVEGYQQWDGFAWDSSGTRKVSNQGGYSAAKQSSHSSDDGRGLIYFVGNQGNLAVTNETGIVQDSYTLSEPGRTYGLWAYGDEVWMAAGDTNGQKGGVYKVDASTGAVLVNMTVPNFDQDYKGIVSDKDDPYVYAANNTQVLALDKDTATSFSDAQWEVALGNSTRDMDVDYTTPSGNTVLLLATTGGLTLVDTELDSPKGGYEVSGTVEGPDGSAIEGATISDGNGNSTTTDASGQYSLTLANGSYSLEAGGVTGYSNTTETVTVDGGPVTQNFSLPYRGASGTVVACPATNPRCDDPSPVSDATVKIWAVNHSKLNSSKYTNLEDRAQDLLSKASGDLNASYDSDLQLMGDGGAYKNAVSGKWVETNPYSSGDNKAVSYAAVHTQADWGLKRYTTGFSLQTPILQGQPNQRLVLSCWQPSSGLNNIQQYNRQMPGALDNGRNLIVEQVSPFGETIETTTMVPNIKRSVGIGQPLNLIGVTFSTGYYDIRCENSPFEMRIKIGQPENKVVAYEENLRTQAGQYTERAQDIRDNLNDGTFETRTMTTNANGKFSVQINDSQLKTVGIQVIRADGQKLKEVQDPSMEDVRNYIQNGYNGSIYLSTEANVYSVPAQDVEIRTVELSTAPFANLSDFQAAWSRLQDLLEEGTYSDLAEWAQGLNEMPTDRLKELNTQYNELCVQNADLQQRCDEILQQVEENNPNLTERQQLIAAISAARQAMDEQQPTVSGGAPTGGPGAANPIADPDEMSDTIINIDFPGVGDDTGTGDTPPTTSPTTDTNGTVDLKFPFDADLTEDGVSPMVEFANGTVRPIDSQYWSIVDGEGINRGSVDRRDGDAVVVQDFPIGDNPGARVWVDVATEEGTGSAETIVRNKAFSGELPSVGAVTLDTLQPTKGMTVTGSLSASRNGVAKAQSVKVFDPQGNEVPATLTNGTFEFTPSQTGQYHVRLGVGNENSTSYPLGFGLGVGTTNRDRPPGVRVGQSMAGMYVLAGDGFNGGQVTRNSETGDLAVSACIEEGSQVPNEVHVYDDGVDMSPNHDTTIRLTRCGSGQNVNEPVTVEYHTRRLSESAQVYRGSPAFFAGNAITTGGTASGKRVDQADQTRISSYTSEDTGELDVSVLGNPGIFQNVIWSLRNTQSPTVIGPLPALPELPLPDLPAFVFVDDVSVAQVEPAAVTAPLDAGGAAATGVVA